MRCVFVCVALAVIGVTNAFAGNVYGTIRENNDYLFLVLAADHLLTRP